MSARHEEAGGVSRRLVLGGLTAATLAAPRVALAAQPRGAAGEVLPLWPGRAPGAPATLPAPETNERASDPRKHDRWLTGIDRPTLTVRRPERPNGAAMMLVPGGGYGFLSWDNEGEEQARWLNALGVTCFILSYRLPGEGWASRATVPLADAQRGVRLIRAQAARFGVDPRRIGVLGFSAGGHLAGSLATRFDEPVYAPFDAADRGSARPDLAALIYPVVSFVSVATHGGSRDNLLGPAQTEAQRRSASVEVRVTDATPPIFLAHAADDGVVPIANSLVLYQAMLAARRPATLHCFEKGGHGFGVRLPDTAPAAAWPTLLASYARASGMFPA